MALKTVLKQLLNKYGPKNNHLEMALISDASTEQETDTPPVKEAKAKHVAAPADDIPEAEVIEPEAAEQAGMEF